MYKSWVVVGIADYVVVDIFLDNWENSYSLMYSKHKLIGWGIHTNIGFP